MIIRGLGKGKPTTIRAPMQYARMVILEESASLPKKRAAAGDLTKSPYCLVRGVPALKILDCLKNLQEIPISNDDLLALIDYDGDLSNQNLKTIEEARKISLNFFMKLQNDRERRSLYNRVRRSRAQHATKLNVLVKTRDAFCDNSPILVEGLVFRDIENKKISVCKTCNETFARADHLKRHTDNETACTTEPTIKPKSRTYGASENVPQELFEAGYIDECHLNFKQPNFGCFDIETTESISDDDTREKAILATLSISFASSIDCEPVFLVRNGDTLQDGKDLVQRFFKVIQEKAAVFKTTVPQKFEDALSEIAKIESERYKQWKQRQTEGVPPAENKLELFPSSWKNWLRSMCTFKIYGFNSAKFDTRVLAPIMFDVMLRNIDCQPSGKGIKKPKLSVLKRQENYFNLSYDMKAVNCKIQFCDILSHLSPCSLSDFLKMTGAPEAKSVFPYQHYNSVAEIKAATEFPPMSAFHSDLKSGLTCDAESYAHAKSIFDNRKSLPDGHPEKWTSMLNFLEHYNNLDVIPMITAIKTWFDTFEGIFGVDGFQKQSLASMAQTSMFKQFSEFSPLLHSLPPWKKDLLDKVRQNIVGGLTTCLHRAVLLDGSDGPEAAKFAPNGSPFTAVIPFDFNRYKILL